MTRESYGVEIRHADKVYFALIKDGRAMLYGQVSGMTWDRLRELPAGFPLVAGCPAVVWSDDRAAWVLPEPTTPD